MLQCLTRALLVCLLVTGLCFAQGSTGTLTGSVEDVSKALIPGVTVTATNNATGVTNNVISNESGAYTIPALLPGTYTLKATLPGFQPQTISNIELGVETKRFNFAMQLAGVSTNIEVNIDATTILTTTGATVGEVMSSSKVMDLPLVSGDVLDLVRIMPGVRLSPAGGGFDTFAGMSANTVNTGRDGLSVTDGRYLHGVFASSTVNPDLVGEIRLILTPVDAEMGRGNGQVQITTKSGTNRYTGTAVWNVRNTALNANTWDNNNDVVTENGITRWQPTQPDWSNENQVTLSYGGPIFRNKTFFFALFDRNLHNQRSLVTGTVLTDTARQGIFRYWEGWNNDDAAAARPADGSASANVIASVDFGGNPLRPFRNQGNTTAPYTGNLRCISAFGTRKADGSPFTAADCPGGIATFPNAGAPGWDTVRPVMDPTGFVARYLAEMPRANYFGTGDGLNTAGVRWLRGNNANSGGGNTTSLQTGQNIGADRKQINIKIDHNFTSNHKINAGYSHEKSGGADFLTNWPNGIAGETQRFSDILTSNFTSTLSSTLLNEARFGIRKTQTASNASWQNETDTEAREKVESFFLQGGPSLYASDSRPMPVLFNPGSGNFAFSAANSLFDTTAVYLGNDNPLYNFADTLRWTKGAHGFRMGGEVRITRSNGYNFLPYNLPRLSGGAGNVTASNIAGLTTANPTGVPGLLDATSLAGGTANTASARNLLYLLAGSIGSGNVGYWITSPDDVEQGRWQDYITADRKYRDQRSNEWSAFFQDDWKVSRLVTLNLGLRYEYYGSTYLKGGFTSTAVGQGYGLFGAGSASTSDIFSNWLNPGAIYLSNYGGTTAGQTAATMLRCTTGVTQARLPVSNCDPTKLTTLEFVGPDSPNPSKNVFPDDRNNFGPAVGFSWQLPFFGEGKTTVRGGYSITYGGPGRNGITLDEVLGGAPGATNTANLSLNSFTNPDGTLEYLDLTDIPRLVPITPTLAPGGSFQVFQKSGAFTAYDPDFATPYTQNFNLSATRTLNRNFTLDVRYVGTRGMKLSSTQDLNATNVFNNPELFGALEAVRAGQESPLFDAMFAGVNLNPGVAGHGAVGTCVTQAAGSTAPGLGQNGCAANQVLQTGAIALRRWQQTNLANGNFAPIGDALNGNPGGVTFLPIPAGTTVGGRLLRNGCDRLAVGAAIGNAPIGKVNTASGPIDIRCFPENWLSMNPQLDEANYVQNTGRSRYDSLQTQVIMRPIHGISLTGTYTWSKTMNLAGADNIDLRNRRADYTLSGNHLTHDFRTNGTFELPIGPNKLLLANTSGWVARLIERWQASFIFNGYTGRPVSVTAGQTLWGGSNPDIVGPFPVRGGSTEWGTIVTNASTGYLGGTYFGSPSPFIKVPDPACAPGGLTDRTDAMGFNLRGNLSATTGNFTQVCTNDALADAKTGQILLQNARPGTRGTLAANTLQTRGVWSFDASMSKTFRISESKSAQIRVDASNVLNHPTPPDPTLNINSGTAFGNMEGDKSGNRSFRGSLRLTF
jgi:hypothetical protein